MYIKILHTFIPEFMRKMEDVFSRRLEGLNTYFACVHCKYISVQICQWYSPMPLLLVSFILNICRSCHIPAQPSPIPCIVDGVSPKIDNFGGLDIKIRADGDLGLFGCLQAMVGGSWQELQV